MPFLSGPSTRMRAPQLEQRLHAHLLAHLERLAIVLGRVVEADGGAVVARRRRDPRAANLRHLVHVHFIRSMPAARCVASSVRNELKAMAFSTVSPASAIRRPRSFRLPPALV